MGSMIALNILVNHRSFTESAEYKQLVVAFPTFGADMALGLASDTINIMCDDCSRLYTVRSDDTVEYDGTICCPFCKCY